MFILANVLAYCGLAAALVLLAATQSRTLAAIAVLAAGFEVLIRLGYLHLAVAHLPLGLVLGLALALPALVAWFRSTGKAAVSAGAIAAFVGLLQVFAYAAPHL
jgi:hypothetical protein